MRDGGGIYSYPAGTEGAPDTTIESSKYNAFIADVEYDLNYPRPVVTGGTGSSNPTDARIALQAERAMQVVTNYDSQPWETGSFASAVGATGSPDGVGAATSIYTGTVEVIDASNAVVEARNLTTGTAYVRKKVGGVWGAWTTDSGAGIFVSKTGDVMSGDLKISEPDAQLKLNKGTGANVAAITSYRNDVLRWSMQLGDAGAESTGNVGSDFRLYSFNDAGGVIGAPLVVTRANSMATFGGDVKISKAQPMLIMNRSDANSAFLQSQYNGLPRWSLQLAAIAETGSNAGSDIYFTRYNDAGAVIDHALWMNRSDGNVYVTRDPTSAQGVATKGYVDAAGNAKVNKSGDSMSGSLSISSSSSPALGVRELSGDGNISLGVLNAAGTAWTHQFYGNGSYSCTGTVNSANVNATGTVYAGAFYCYSGNNPCYLGRNTNDAAMVYGILNAAGTAWTISLNGNGSLNCQSGWKPGGGLWADSSDARIKNVQGDYEHGLDEVLALRPVRYTFKGNDVPLGLPETPESKEVDAAPYPESPHYNAAVDGTEFIGLVAQEAEGVMPELVTMRRARIDGVLVNDLRALDSGALIYALVNAVKTLAARVAALEATP